MIFTPESINETTPNRSVTSVANEVEAAEVVVFAEGECLAGLGVREWEEFLCDDIATVLHNNDDEMRVYGLISVLCR
jgi:hypothetical protein